MGLIGISQKTMGIEVSKKRDFILGLSIGPMGMFMGKMMICHWTWDLSDVSGIDVGTFMDYGDTME